MDQIIVEDPRPAFVGYGGYIGAKSEEWEGWGGGGAGSFFGVGWLR